MGAALGVGAALALAGLVFALIPAEAHEQPKARVARRAVPPRRVAIAITVGAVAGLLTRWPVAAALGVAAVLGLPVLFGPRASSEVIAQLEALASWTETLRDMLGGPAGLNQAIMASAEVAPLALAPSIHRLSARLVAGTPQGVALRALGNELDDATADGVVAALVLAAEAEAGRLAEMLGALAASTRQQVEMRLRIEASRARAWSTMRTVAGVSIAFVVIATVFARSFVGPYGSAGGQLVLLVVGALYAAGLWLMAAMVRPARSERFLGGPS